MWQDWQKLEDRMCVDDFPVAVTPLWQLAQGPVTVLWSKAAEPMVQPLIVSSWHTSQLALVTM
jgi:hypothetical protein